MILDEYVEVKLYGGSVKYYEDLGFKIPKKIDSNGKMVTDFSQTIKVSVGDLQNGSHVLINVKCDFCGLEKQVVYKHYYNSCLAKNEPYACSDCGFEKTKNTMLREFGVENQMQLQSFRDKSKITMLEKYGVEYARQSVEIVEKSNQTSLKNYGVINPLESEIVRDKIKETMINRYGESNPMQVKEIREKAYNTNLKTYGVKYAIQSPAIKEKIMNTNLKRYGVKYALQNSDIIKKANYTKYKNGSIVSSTQQRHLNSIYNGILNYPYGNYNIDIYLKETNIAVEYDGRGHNLTVVLNQKTEKEFNISEIIRGKFLKKCTIKQIHIISSTDKLPSDDILLNMLEISKQYFSSTNHTWFEWYLDENKFRNAENIDGSFFDYGKLKRIKQSA